MTDMADNNIAQATPESAEAEAKSGGIATAENGAQRGNKEETRAFSERLRQKTAETEQRLRAEYQPLLDALMEQGYEGGLEEIAASLQSKASQDNESAEKRDSVMALQQLEQARNYAELERAKGIVQQDVFARDLAAVRQEYPELAAKHVGELGETFLGIMAACEAFGIKVDPVAAFEAQRASDKRRPDAPPAIGALSDALDAGAREFFTSEELDRLTPRQLDDPGIMAKAMRSLKRLK